MGMMKNSSFFDLFIENNEAYLNGGGVMIDGV